jgi:ribonuclease J
VTAKARSKIADSLVMVSLGGIGEIGMNCYCYGTGNSRGRQWLMVDLGVKFGGEREPGIDVVLPDVSFIGEKQNNLAGLVVTHGHEDHIGAIAWLWPQLRCDIHCTPFVAELLKLKLREHGFYEEVRFTIHAPGSRFQAGQFQLEYVPLTHSIPESCGLLIEAGSGRVFHSGDWKIDRTPVLGRPFDERRLAQIGDSGVDALVCDSTNVLREGHSPSESDVAAALADIVKGAEGRVAVTTFASHVERILSAVKAARRAGREVVVAGRAMRNTIEAARICGILRDAGSFLDEEEFGYLPRDRVLLLCTGSQGEARAAIARIAEDSHPEISLDPGDLVVFSARTIPGNEKDVSSVLNNLAKLQIDAVTSDDALVHSSGHPRRGELRDMYKWIRPRSVVPMHGEARHLRAHSQFALSCGINETAVLENGKVVRLAPGPVETVDEFDLSVLHVDGKLIVPGEDGPAKERRKLSFVGVVFVSLLIDDRIGLSDGVQVETEGLPRELSGDIASAAEQAFASLPKLRRKIDSDVVEAVRIAVRRECEQIWGKRPVCKVIVARV